MTKVIRTHTVKKGQVVVLLDDGHEETQKTPVLKNPNKEGPITKADITEEKNKKWINLNQNCLSDGLLFIRYFIAFFLL